MSPKNSPVRIKDIALKAGVSTGTVDRVIHKRGRVAEDVRVKVLKIIDEMNYEPNLMARSLASKKTYNLAVLIPDHKIDSYWEAPKMGVEKAEHELRQFGIVVHQFVFNPNLVESFIEKANEITQSKPDGIFLSPIFYRETLPFFEKWKKQGIPFVLFNTQIGDYDPLTYIGQDSYQSGMLAAKLIHYGQPNPCSILIAHIDEEPGNAAHLLKKEQGFCNYFKGNDIDHQYKIVTTILNKLSASSFIKQLDEIIDSHPDLKSIFVTTSKAHQIANHLEQRHVTHIKIIGYDLLQKNLHYLNKGAISFLINQNPKGQGFWGINILTDFLVFRKEVPILKYLPLDIVTKENLNYYLED
ncbi:LacI family DNA-binding transcriptional regulator [Mucilaginibacter sp.]|jgi:LacI family transcriptional regulator|uniref:LacI family DNA-binding transcriptional regulator n=1 Tax=Mucilaginibacter sp. TaxID=1882438 RepID=UPI0035668534